MKRYFKINLIIIVALLIAITANAQHLNQNTTTINYDARNYHEFVWGRGGAEGHSGAYIQISLGVTGYNEIIDIKAKAEHVDTDFEITLQEEDKSCVGVWPQTWGSDQLYDTWLRPLNWMIGEWKLKLEYKKDKVTYKEETKMVVPRFNFPPAPTGVEIAFYNDQNYLVWNRIGDPGSNWPPNKHVEYRVRHYSNSHPKCIDEDYVIRPDANPYELWSGNRIAIPLPPHWQSGDHIRIENRVFDDNNFPDGPYRWDRGCKHFFLP